MRLTRLKIESLLVTQIALTSIAAAETNIPACEFTESVTLEWTSKVSVNKELLPQNLRTESFFHDAIEQQVKFGIGQLMHSKSGGQIMIRMDKPSIRFQVDSESEYSQELKVDRIEHPDFSHSSNEYIESALRKGVTLKKDKAYSISYTVVLEGVKCKSAVPSNDGKVKLPTDPYLAYWYLEKKERRPIRWRQSELISNPCANEEFVDVPDPLYYWYFWDPVKTGRDKSGDSFNCAANFGNKSTILEIPYKISTLSQKKSSTSLDASMLANSNLLRSTILFGILDSKSKKLTLNDLFEKGETATSIDVLKSKLVAFKTSIQKLSPEEVDRGSLYFLNFIEKIPDVLRIIGLVTRKDTNTIELSGELYDSKKKVTMKVFLGNTDLLSPEKPDHWKLLFNSLAEADIIIYNGHSGLGENIKLKNLMEGLKLRSSNLKQAILKAPKLQLIGILSCYSFSYFVNELSELRKSVKSTNKTITLLTGSDFTSERGPLGVLDHIDKLISKKPLQRSGPALVDSRYFFPDDYIIVENN